MKRFAPKQHVTQMLRLTELRSMLIMRETWPPPEWTLTGYRTSLGDAVVEAEIAGEDMRRRARG